MVNYKDEMPKPGKKAPGVEVASSDGGLTLKPGPVPVPVGGQERAERAQILKKSFELDQQSKIKPLAPGK